MVADRRFEMGAQAGKRHTQGFVSEDGAHCKGTRAQDKVLKQDR
jgi:hypothetical protein